MYQVNEAKAEISFADNSKHIKEDLDYDRITISLGYRF